MEEQPKLTYRLIPELEETGSRKELEGILPLEHFYRGYQRFELDGGVSYRLELTNTGEGVLLRGRARGIGKTECARCLEEAAFDVEGDAEGFFILNPSEKEIEQSDDEFTAVPKDGIVDLMPPVIAALIYEMPLIVLCKQDCAGLCQHCGVDLNVEPCECKREPSPDHPFAILKNLISQN